MTAPCSPADASLAGRPGYAVSFGGRGSGYENRREGDRIIQDASAPVRNTQYNALAYSPDTFPPASPALLASAAEPQRPAASAPPSPGAAACRRGRPERHLSRKMREPAVHETAKPAPQARRLAISRTVKRPPMPTPAPHRALHPPQARRSNGISGCRSRGGSSCRGGAALSRAAVERARVSRDVLARPIVRPEHHQHRPGQVRRRELCAAARRSAHAPTC